MPHPARYHYRAGNGQAKKAEPQAELCCRIAEEVAVNQPIRYVPGGGAQQENSDKYESQSQATGTSPARLLLLQNTQRGHNHAPGAVGDSPFAVCLAPGQRFNQVAMAFRSRLQVSGSVHRCMHGLHTASCSSVWQRSSRGLIMANPL